MFKKIKFNIQQSKYLKIFLKNKIFWIHSEGIKLYKKDYFSIVKKKLNFVKNHTCVKILKKKTKIRFQKYHLKIIMN